MSDRAEMQRMAEEVVSQLGKSWHVMSIHETPNRAYEWCVAFTGPNSPALPVCVSWGIESTYITVKSELRVKPILS